MRLVAAAARLPPAKQLRCKIRAVRGMFQLPGSTQSEVSLAASRSATALGCLQSRLVGVVLDFDIVQKAGLKSVGKTCVSLMRKIAGF